MAVVVGLVGVLVDITWPAGESSRGEPLRPPAAVVAAALRERGVAVPDGWADEYRDGGVDAPDGAAVPLPARTAAVLDALGVEAAASTVRRAVVAAADPAVSTRPGAAAAVAAAPGPVGLFVDAAVPELPGRILARTDLGREAFDAVRSAGGTGWRAASPRAIEAVAAGLSVTPESVGAVVRGPERAAAARAAGATAIDVGEEERSIRAAIETAATGSRPDGGDRRPGRQ